MSRYNLQNPKQRVFYRGTEPGRRERIQTGAREWDSYLFVTDTPQGARWYGSSVEVVTLKPSARVLYEGTGAFPRGRGARRNESLLSWSSRVAAEAKTAGWDAVHFERQTDVGTPILNLDAIESRKPLAGDLAALGLPAYHGSPYDFEQFSLHKIGTGEGAQAYGWGLYFAGEKAVADYYKNALAKPPTVYVDGIEIRRLTIDEVFVPGKDALKTVASRISDQAKVANYLGHSTSDAMALVRKVKDDIWNGLAVNSSALQESIERKDTAEHIASNRRVVKSLEDQLRVVQDLLKREVTIRFTGGTYKVEIPELEELLGYDEPLSEQPAIVAKLRAAGKTIKNEEGDEFIWTAGKAQRPLDMATGLHLYIALTDELGSAQRASEYLLSIGIPGLRYYDAASRGDGKGSYNFVIWDDGRVEITEKLSGLRVGSWMRTPGGRR